MTHTQDYLSQPGNSPTVNPDVQEALSIKYGNGGIILCPLSSGNLAVFDRGFRLHDIISDPSNGYFKQQSLIFKTQLTSRTDEARFYGEPDDKTYKRDTIHARRVQQHAEKKTVDVSDFAF